MARFFAAIALFFAIHQFARANAYDIVIVLPVEHQALADIASGFQREFFRLNPNSKSKITSFNAQGNQQLEKSILEKCALNPEKIVVPISTNTARMAVSLARKNRIMAIGAVFPEVENKKLPRDILDRVGLVSDQIPSKMTFSFFKEIEPALKKFTVVYSSNEKVFKEIADLEEVCRQNGVKMHKIMVQTQSELYQLTQQIPSDSSFIYMPKDNLVASGVSVLQLVSQAAKIPLISSDEGSVRKGAAIALAIPASEVGEEGARLLTQFIQGKKSFASLGAVRMTQTKVYVNQKSVASFPEIAARMAVVSGRY